MNFKEPGARSRLLAASSAAAILILGLGASALLPHSTSNASSNENPPAHLQQIVAVHNVPPHMPEAGAPFSFADLVERVSPAAVTGTVPQAGNAAAGPKLQALPETIRTFFYQKGQDGQHV